MFDIFALMAYGKRGMFCKENNLGEKIILCKILF